MSDREPIWIITPWPAGNSAPLAAFRDRENAETYVRQLGTADYRIVPVTEYAIMEDTAR